MTATCNYQHADQKHVSFGNDTNQSNTTVHETMCRLDFSAEETQNYWYSTMKLESIQQEASDIGRQMETNPNISDQICTRGLETQTARGMEVCRRVRTCSRTAVFQEQQRQRLRGGTINEYSLALAYEEQTTRCQVHALTRGIADKLECEREWRKEQSTSTRSLTKKNSKRMSRKKGSGSRRSTLFSSPRSLRMRLGKSIFSSAWKRIQSMLNGH